MRGMWRTVGRCTGRRAARIAPDEGPSKRQSVKLSQLRGSPHQASSLFTQILFQPPQYKRKTSRAVLPIISPACCTISVGQTPYPRQWGAQVQWQASRIFASLQKSPLTPLPKGFCGEALPHEDLSAIPRSNPLNEGTLLTGYGWGCPATRAGADPGE